MGSQNQFSVRSSACWRRSLSRRQEECFSNRIHLYPRIGKQYPSMSVPSEKHQECNSFDFSFSFESNHGPSSRNVDMPQGVLAQQAQSLGDEKQQLWGKAQKQQPWGKAQSLGDEKCGGQTCWAKSGQSVEGNPSPLGRTLRSHSHVNCSLEFVMQGVRPYISDIGCDQTHVSP